MTFSAPCSERSSSVGQETGAPPVRSIEPRQPLHPRLHADPAALHRETRWRDCPGGAVEKGDFGIARLTQHLPWADAVIEGPARELVRIDAGAASTSGLYVEGLSSAILARVVAKAFTKGPRPARRRSGLLKWRLKKVADFVDSNLEQPLRLADVARASGLSRMHFAAQFRAATGMTPHDYVIARRIERACALLRETERPLAEIALEVGFQTQSHFTTVFNRLAGQPPGRWRSLALRRGGAPCSS